MRKIEREKEVNSVVRDMSLVKQTLYVMCFLLLSFSADVLWNERTNKQTEIETCNVMPCHVMPSTINALTSSPRSSLSLFCWWKLSSSFHFLQISTSASAKFRAGGRKDMVGLVTLSVLLLVDWLFRYKNICDSRGVGEQKRGWKRLFY